MLPTIVSRRAVAARAVAALALTVALVVAAAGPSLASASIALVPNYGPPTTVTEVDGSGFAPGENVAIRFDGVQLARASANGQGDISRKVTIPQAATPGDHNVTAEGLTSGNTATAVFLVRTNWLHLGFDYPHTGENPYENVLGPSNVDQLTPRWIGHTQGRVNSSPAFADGYVYVGSFDNNLSVFDDDCASGGGSCTPTWIGRTGGDIFSSPTVDPDTQMVFVGSNDTYVYAFPEFCPDAECPYIWRFQTRADVRGSAAVKDGIVYIGSHDGRLYALDEQTGAELWEANPGGGVRSYPAIADGRIFVGSLNHHVLAYPEGPDCATPPAECQPLWDATVGGQVQGMAAVAHGLVYIGAADGVFYAFDEFCSNPCSPTWKAVTGGDIRGGAAVTGDVVFTGAGDGNLYAFDATCGTGGATCSPLWTGRTGRRTIKSTPGIANGVVYIGSGAGSVYAFPVSPSCSNPCQPLFVFSTGDPVRTSPAIANATVYLGSRNFNVYALSLP